MTNAPTNLSVSAFSSTEVDLAWSSVAGAAYNAYAAPAIPGGFGPYVKLNNSPLSSTTFADNAANSSRPPAAGKAYLYRVTAIVASVESALSSAVSAIFMTPQARVVSFNESDLKPIYYGPQSVPAIYTAYGFPPANINVIYDREAGEFAQGGASIHTQKPQVRAMVTDVPNISNKAQVAINGIIYYVTNFKDNGAGVMTIMLSLQPV